MECFGLPEIKRFQRFILSDPADFIHPEDRSEDYTIIESPQAHWGIRGMPGDELALNYPVVK
ncbi:MAG: hypothetical protein ACOC0D_02780 [Spirochaeta sp.]